MKKVTVTGMVLGRTYYDNNGQQLRLERCNEYLGFKQVGGVSYVDEAEGLVWFDDNVELYEL